MNVRYAAFKDVLNPPVVVAIKINDGAHSEIATRWFAIYAYRISNTLWPFNNN